VRKGAVTMRSVRGICLAAVGTLLGACGQEAPPRVADAAADATAVERDAGAADASVQVSSPDRPDDAGVRETSDLPADATSTADAEPDAPPDAAPDAEPDAALDAAPVPDAPLMPECTPGTRACVAGPATRLCNDQGRWVPGESCGSASVCSGGACVCAAGTCEDAVLRAEPGYVAEIAIGGNTLYYRYAIALDSDIRSIDLRTGMPGPIQRAAAGYYVNSGLAADPQGAVYWCRRLSDENAPLEGALMRGDGVLAAGACTRLRLTDSHVLFKMEDENGLFRFPRAGAGSRETVTTKYPASFDSTPTHLYFASADDGPRLWSRIERIPVDNLGAPPQTIAERAGFDTHIFDYMAIDADYVYVPYQGQILRAAIAGGDFQTFWSGDGSDIRGIVMSDTHVYWMSEIESERGCSESAFWRRSKLRDDEATLLARRDGVCPTGLQLTPDHLYAATSGLPGPSRIFRLRR
jgi:hypothetical protein